MYGDIVVHSVFSGAGGPALGVPCRPPFAPRSSFGGYEPLPFEATVAFGSIRAWP